METPSLSISLLGPPVILLNGSPIQIKRRKVRFLLYYLACQPYQVSRESLCEMFWPEDGEEEARKNLREALANLKKSLPGDDYLIVRGDYISLDESKVFVDAREFEKITQIVRRNLNISQTSDFTETIYAKVSEGINLWRSSGFISGASLIDSENFQHWASERNASYEVWHQMMLEWLADHCISMGHLNDALKWLSMALLKDRQNTELNILVIKCLKDLGASSELRHYCDTMENVYQEKGQSIMPKLLNDVIAQAREMIDIPIEKPKLIWTRLEKIPAHYVDLRQRSATLRNFLQRGGIFLVRGEAGSGKSRLLQEFYDSLEVIPRLLYYQSCPHEFKIPYQPLVGSIKPVVSENEWNSLDLVYAKALFPLFPELQKIRNDIRPTDLEAAVHLHRLIPEAFWNLLTIIGRQRKVVYIFDDAQWCDPETMQVLTYIFEQETADEYATAIFAAQSNFQNKGLEEFVDRYKNTRFMDVVDLLPLNGDEISEMIYLFTGSTPPDNDVLWVMDECGGNPKLLIRFMQLINGNAEELSHLVEKDQYSIKGELSDLIAKRLKILSEKNYRILQSAAMLGRRFSINGLIKISRNELEEIEVALKAFQSESIIQPLANDSNLVEYKFIHRMIHRYLLQTMAQETKYIFQTRISDEKDGS